MSASSDSTSGGAGSGRELRIGFVGAGGNARGHMSRLAEIEGVRITAVCDVDEGRAKEAAAEHGARAYTDHHPLLDGEELTALYVSVPPFAHTDAEVLAARKGVHVFVEKPVALSMDKGLEVLAAIEGAGVLSCVGYQLRYLDMTRRLSAYLRDKTVALISSHRWGGLPGTPWWRVMDQSGGQLVEQTTHQVDIMRMCCGEIASAYARYATLAMGSVANLTIPDTQAVLFEFESGTLATLSTTPMCGQGGGRGDIVFLMENQSVGWGTQALTCNPAVPELEGEPKPTPNIDQVFVDAIRANDQSLIASSYRNGLRTLDATLAANESARTGKAVKTRMSG